MAKLALSTEYPYQILCQLDQNWGIYGTKKCHWDLALRMRWVSGDDVQKKIPSPATGD